MKLFYDSGFRSLSEDISQYRVDICGGLTLFTIHLWLPNLPCLIFLFQLADDRNFIHHLEPLWPEPFHCVPPKYLPASFLGLLLFPFSHHRIGSHLSSSISTELREGQACVLLGSVDFELVTVVFWSRSCVISAVVRQNWKLQGGGDEWSRFTSSTQLGQQFLWQPCTSQHQHWHYSLYIFGFGEFHT